MTSLSGYIRKKLFGYDLFISYSRKDSLDYAYSISSYLMAPGKAYECYIDQVANSTPGSKIPKNVVSAIRRSKGFILIISDCAQESNENDAIPQEIDVFLKNNENKFFIPININGAINIGDLKHLISQKNAEVADDLTGNRLNVTPVEKRIYGLPLINETLYNFQQKQVGDHVSQRIENALKFTKKSIRLRWLALIILLGILFTVSAAAIFSYQKTAEAARAIAARDTANVLEKAAKQQTQKAIESKDRADLAKETADSLQQVATYRVVDLTHQSQTLKTRIAAEKYMKTDPVIAYRLAEKAYMMNAEPENRKVFMEATSNIDLHADYILRGYEIKDFKEPFVLLKQTDYLKKQQWAVFNINDRTLQPLKLASDEAWLFIADKSWKILTMRSSGEKDPTSTHPIFQLYDDHEKPLYTPVHGRYMTAFPLNKNKIAISLNSEPKILVWNVNTNDRKYINIASKDGYRSYDVMGITSDGKAVLRDINNYFLTDRLGNTLANTLTKIGGDPMYTKVDWSADEKYSSVYDTDIKSVYIWDINRATAKQLDPHGWVVNACAWSNHGHMIAIAGRNENETNVTIEIIDAENPEKSRRLLYTDNAPVNDLVFLNGDQQLAACNKDGKLIVMQIADGKVVQTGAQQGIYKLFSSSKALLSGSFEDVRLWSTSLVPGKFWSFYADAHHTYLQTAAGDPAYTWLAVPCRTDSNTIGANYIELRNIKTFQQKKLIIPKQTAFSLEFSNNGNWLLYEVSDTLRIWDTKTWKYYDFPRFQKKGQFINLKLKGDTVIAHVTKGMETDPSSEYDFTIFLNDVLKKPVLLKRTLSKGNEYKSYRESGEALTKKVAGWDIDRTYKYQSAGITSAPKSEWAVSVKCRDFSLGARDCDVQFIPLNIDQIRKIYDQIIWKPLNGQLERLIDQK